MLDSDKPKSIESIDMRAGSCLCLGESLTGSTCWVYLLSDRSKSTMLSPESAKLTLPPPWEVFAAEYLNFVLKRLGSLSVTEL